ncbi:MAG: CFI-box-CTERM domain-containing protein [Planctomycetota bacterium]|jgi:hypothetical protein
MRMIKHLLPILIVLLYPAAGALALDDPSNFRLIDCSSTTLTWSWDDISGEVGYVIYDNDTLFEILPDLPADSTTTIETGLSPNTTYVRYIVAYEIVSAFENCGAVTSGYANSTAKAADTYLDIQDGVCGYINFGLGNLSVGTIVTGVRIYAYCYDESAAVGLMDIRMLTTDPVGGTGPTIYSESGTGTLFLDDSTGYRSQGYKVFDLTLGNAAGWVADAISPGWCAAGFREDNASTDSAYFRPFDYSTTAMRPWLEVEYESRNFSGQSNIIASCTLAALPALENSVVTFTAHNDSSVTVQVGPNGNPPGTGMELEYAKGDRDGPTESFAPLGSKTGGYVWISSGLDYGSSYWFRARSRNWSGAWSDYCDVTVWSTLAGPPDNFGFIDRTDTAITWSWESRGGGRLHIYDNDTNLEVVSDIPVTATCTVEAGLSPNTSYRRYIRAVRVLKNADYYFAGNDGQITTSSNTEWENICTLNLNRPASGNYLVMASAQVASHQTLGGYYSEFRLIRDAAVELNYMNKSTYYYFHSFMGSEVLSANGIDDYKYQLQMRSITNGFDSRARNASIIAIRLPAGSFNYIDNSTEASNSTGTFQKHTGLTVAPSVVGDYWIIHSSRMKHSPATIWAYSKLVEMDNLSSLTSSMRDPVHNSEWIFQGGFSVLKSVSSNVALEHQFRSFSATETCYVNNVHIAALCLADPIWEGYADNAYTGAEQSTANTAGTTACVLSFTVSKPQMYCIASSSAIGLFQNHVDFYVGTWVEHTNSTGTYALDGMASDVQKIQERINFASVRLKYLEAGSHDLELKFRTNSTSYTAYIQLPSLITLPLEGSVEELTNRTAVVEVCTMSAVPLIDNSAATFVYSNANNIYIQVDENGNPPDTPIELSYARGDENGPTTGFTAAGIQTAIYEWDLAGLTSDSSYWFRVRARNWSGVWSDYSDLAVVSTTEVTSASLNIPAGLGYVSCASTTLTWSWVDTNSAPNESGSDLFNGGDNAAVVSDIASDVETTTETGLLPNRTYNRYIRAFIDLGEKKYSGLSSVAAGVTLGAVPGKPSFSGITTTSVSVTWSRTGNPLYTIFELARSKGGPWISVCNRTNTAFGDIGLAAGVTYYYRVRTVNLEGAPSDWSENDSFVTLPPGDPVVSLFSGPVLVYGPAALPPISFTCDQDADYQLQLYGDGTPGNGDILYSGSVSAGVQVNQVLDRDIDLTNDDIPLSFFVTCVNSSNSSSFGYAACTIYDDTLAPDGAVTFPADGQEIASIDSIGGNAVDFGGGNVGLVELVLHDVTADLYFDNTTGGFTSLSPVFCAAQGAENWAFDTTGIIFTDCSTYTTYVKVTDTVGNVGTESGNVSFTFNDALPDITIISPDVSPPTVIGPNVDAEVRWEVNIDCDYFLRVGGNGSIATGTDVGNGSITATTPITTTLPATDFPDDAVEELYIIVQSVTYAIAFKYRDFEDDETTPVTNVSTTLSGDMQPPGVISGTSSDATAGLALAEIAIRDSSGLYYSPVSGSFEPGTIFIITDGLDSWTYNTLAIPWMDGETYTVSIRVTDLVGNIEQRDIGSFNAVVPAGTGSGGGGGGGGGGGCFLATACYESGISGPGTRVVANSTGIYFISQADFGKLETLRAFRDGVLSGNSMGRAFIRHYYRISPSLAFSIRTRPAAKTFVRWMIVTPAYLFAREALGESYLLRTLSFLLLIGMLALHRRRRRMRRQTQ